MSCCPNEIFNNTVRKKTEKYLSTRRVICIHRLFFQTFSAVFRPRTHKFLFENYTIFELSESSKPLQLRLTCLLQIAALWPLPSHVRIS